MSKNQYGVSGLAVRAPLQERIARYHRIKDKLAAGYTLDQVAFQEQISRERVRQIARGPEPKMPGRPLPR